MSIIVENIALYLGRRKGISSDYKLVLTLFESNPSTSISPNVMPLARAERQVSDIDSDNWYVFNFDDPVSLSEGYYSITLHQENDDEYSPVDFNANFCEWVHSEDLDSGKQIWSFSTASGFQWRDDVSDYGYGFGYGVENGIAYGYGYGYGSDEPYDYFQILGIGGDTDGEGAFGTGYGYGFGYENVIYDIDNSVCRTFKVYEKFNDISFDEDGKYVRVNLPPAETSTETISNRQEFLDATKRGVEVVGNLLTLSEPGGRVYSADCSNFDSSSESVNWYKSNFFLSNNDINHADIINPPDNTNQFRTWLMAAPYYSGIYFSTDGGSAWRNRSDGFVFADGAYRNFSCVIFKYDADYDYIYAIAFDDTNLDERGKVFYSIITPDVVDDDGDILTQNSVESDDITWIEAGRITDGGTGLKVNTVMFVGSDLWVGTTDGVYSSTNYGTWTVWGEITTLPAGTNINHISASYLTPVTYGYGYGYGEGGSYFDVLGASGYLTGYGVDEFESTFYGEYGFGYGYENIWGRQYVEDVYIATDIGPYIYQGGTWVNLSSDKCYCINVSNDRIYIGTDSGILRSIDGGTTFEGDSPLTDTFYSYGLLPRKTTSILSNIRDLNEIYVSQYGGIFISKNNAGDFTYVANGLTESRVKLILQNPLNNRALYAFTETVSFLNSAVTFLIDSSGSMEANDTNNVRLDLVNKVISNIHSSAVATPYFQIVKFGLREVSTGDTPGYTSLRTRTNTVDFPGTDILTSTGDRGGFVAADLDDGNVVSTLAGIVSGASNVSHSRTPLFDSIDVLSRGINNSGSSWEYISPRYIVEDVASEYFKSLHKSVIIITDGYDTVNNKDVSDLVENFSSMRSEVYIVGVGNNVNFNNLKQIKDSHPFAHLYVSGESEGIYRGNDTVYDFDDFEAGSVEYLDLADSILERERIQTREGYWKKMISYTSARDMFTCEITANTPPLTSCQFRVRSSTNKETWTAWTDYFEVNIINDINLFGKFFEIEIKIDSQTTTYSPEVSNIEIVTLIPSESYVLYDSKSSGRRKISELTFESLDDNSLSVVDEEDVKIDFGFLQSSSSNFDLSTNINRGKRSVVGRKGKESLTTDNGYFYSAENGAWPMNLSVSTDGVNVYDSDGKIVNRDKYYIIPDMGFVMFYDSQKISNNEFKSYKLEILYGTQYRITSKITNYTTNIDHFDFHDVSWSYYSEGDSVVRRPAIPFVSSQISGDLYYGRIGVENYAVSRGLSTTYTLQYIEKNETGFIGNIDVSTGMMINLQTDSSEDAIWKYYEQNAFLDDFNIRDASGFSYVSAYVGDDSTRLSSSKLLISPIDDGFGEPQIHKKITITLDEVLNQTETLGIIIGDSSQASAGSGTKGIPTWIKQSNMLFNSKDNSYGELETSFVFGVNGVFSRPLEPTAKLCGKPAEKIVITAPTILSTSSIFSFTLLAVDVNGLIDREFVGEVNISFSDPSLGTLNNQSLYFELYDEGFKIISAFTGGVSGIDGYIEAEIVSTGKTFKSNTIEINDSIKVKWGDLNVGSLLSDGRQDVEFIANYAKNISQLDFVCVCDDLSFLSEHTDGDTEWQYLVSKCEELSIGGLDVFPGLRHRCSLLFGERIILFDDFDFTPNVLITDPAINQDNPIDQLNNLISDLNDYSFITIPIRSAIEPALPGNTDEPWFVNRGFDFENYRSIVQLVTNPTSLVYSTEPLVEVYSEHGFCEEIKESYISNSSNFTSLAGSQYMQHGLHIGKKFGFTASSGGYASRPGYYTGELSPKTETKIPSLQTEEGDIISPRGLTAVLVNDSNRSSLVSALKARNCYCTTGAKIHVSFSGISGSRSGIMGDELGVLEKTAENKPLDSIILNISVKADRSTIKEIVVYRTIIDEIPFVAVHRHYGAFTGEESFTFEDTDMADAIIYDITGKEICYYIRVEQRNGHFAWASPIWFNFGRDDVISSAGGSGGTSIRSITLSNSTSKNLVGTFSSSSAQTTPLSEFSVTSPQPSSQRGLFYGDSATSTNYTTRKTYSDASLIIGDKTPGVYAMRMFVNEITDTNILYGTNFLKFLYTETDKGNYALYHSSASTDPNGSNFSDQMKYSKDWGAYPTGNHGMLGRSKLFGYVWQYSNNGNIGDGYDFDMVNANTDKIIKQSSSYIPIVRDPFMIYEGSGQYGILYTGYVTNNYPEKDGTTISNRLSIDPSINESYDTSQDPLPTEIGDWGRVEDFAGLLEVDLWNSVDRHRILYTNTEDQTEERVFNTSGSPISLTKSCSEVEGDIIYPTCPNYITDGTNKRIYYLGWFRGTGNNKPTLGLFVANINGFESDDFTNATNNLGFVFNNAGVPATYTPRVTSFRTEDFIWPAYYDSSIASNVTSESLVNWPRATGNFYPHPAFSLGLTWLSVIRYDDGIYYAFINKMMTRSSTGVIDSAAGGGTAILYSTDGINFYEYDALDISRIPSLLKPSGSPIYYCHPFKFNSRWYTVYSDISDFTWTTNAMAKFKYSAFSWQSISDFTPH